jgi:hypothetical protein
MRPAPVRDTIRKLMKAARTRRRDGDRRGRRVDDERACSRELGHAESVGAMTNQGTVEISVLTVLLQTSVTRHPREARAPHVEQR